MKFNFVIVLPRFGVSTVEAYKGIDYDKMARQINKTELMEKSLKIDDKETVLNCLHNDFELSVFKSHPELKIIKQKMLEAGCNKVKMSGSGSTTFSLVKNSDEAKVACQKLQEFNVLSVRSL